MKNVLIGAALVAAQFTTPALAGRDEIRRDVRVEIADLDLGTRSGVAELDRRLEKAVVRACGTAHHLEPEQLNDLERCRADALMRAGAARDALLNRKAGGATLPSRASK